MIDCPHSCSHRPASDREVAHDATVIPANLGTLAPPESPKVSMPPTSPPLFNQLEIMENACSDEDDNVGSEKSQSCEVDDPEVME